MSVKFSQNALKILEDRYLLRNEKREIIETPEEMIERVVSTVSKNEPEKKEEFREIISSFKFMPNSPTLMNAGNHLGMLSACFVIPVEDSMHGIFKAVHDLAIVQKAGGGTGFSFDKLSEKGAYLVTSQGEASGPVSFMKVFNQASATVEQGGKRRAANMGILGCDHPDIIEFIEVKNKKQCSICGKVVLRNEFTCPKCGNALPEDTTLSYFNLSVGVNDKFVEYAIDYVEKGIDHDWHLYSRREPNKIVKTIKFSELWNKIVFYAWYSGEPGLIYLDRINEKNPMRKYKLITACNPCGEMPLLPYDSCNLGSINLDVLTDMEGNLDWDELERVTRLAVDFLDNVIDVNKYPLPEIEEATKSTRNIGLGVMGLARMLQKMELPYDSKEARKKVKEVMLFIQNIADNQSIIRGKKYGTFPLWEKSIYAGTDLYFRNATRTTIAPTGSISTLVETSGGIEPDFSHRFTRIVNGGDEKKEFRIIIENPVLVEKLKKYDLYSKELMKEIEENGGRLPDVYKSKALVGIDSKQMKNYLKLQEIFKTASEISVEGHIDMLIIVQSIINNAVSKTINLPSEATQKEVANAFIRMLKGGAKGVTVYRDGSRASQPLVAGNKEELKEETKKNKRGYVEPARDYLPSIKRRLYTGCGILYIHADYDPETGDIKEIFIDKGSTGGCQIFTKATSRLLSVGIRGGIPLEILVDQLNSAGSCPSYQYARGKGNKVSEGMSCPSAIGREVLKIQKELHKAYHNKAQMQGVQKEFSFDKEVEEVLKVKEDKKVPSNICPECGCELSSESGCIVCKYCGFSRC